MRLIGKALVSKLFLFVVDLKLMAVADADTGCWCGLGSHMYVGHNMFVCVICVYCVCESRQSMGMQICFALLPLTTCSNFS